MTYTSEQDPLCYQDTSVLINKAGLKTQSELDEFELGMFMIRSAEALPLLNFDTKHYRAIHQHLFGDVYDWAGQYRTIRIAKGESWFCYPEHIEKEMNNLFDKLQEQAFFSDISKIEFTKLLAEFWSDLNAIHPFREGNGRTQIIFINQLAKINNFELKLTDIKKGDLFAAIIGGFNGNTQALQRLLSTMLVSL